MVLSPWKLLAVLIVAVALSVNSPTGRAVAEEKSTTILDIAEFKKLATALHIKNQPWASVPWKVSVTEARAAAAKAKRPIFLVVNTGNCLGFV